MLWSSGGLLLPTSKRGWRLDPRAPARNHDPEQVRGQGHGAQQHVATERMREHLHRPADRVHDRGHVLVLALDRNPNTESAAR
jgi:hypothetical protein